MALLGGQTKLLGNNAEAIRLLEEARDVVEAEPLKSFELSKKAHESFAANKEWDNACDAFRLMVSSMLSVGDLEAASQMAFKKLQDARMDKNKEMEAQAQFALAELMLVLGDIHRCKEFAKLAESTFKELGKKIQAVKCNMALAQAYMQEADPVPAEKLAREVLVTWKDIGEKEGLATAYHLLSSARSMGGPGDTMEPMKKALKMYREIGWRKYEAIMLYNLAEMHRMNQGSGGLPLAQQEIEEALEIWRSIGCIKGEASCIHSVVLIMVERGLTSDAMQVMRDRMQELRSQDDKRGQVTLACALVEVMKDINENEEALALAEQVLAVAREIGARQAEAHLLQLIALVRNRLGQNDESVACGQEALSIFQELGDMNGERSALKALSHAYTGKKEAHKAPLRTKALDLLGQFVQAVSKKDTAGFKKTIGQLREIQGIDGHDINAAIGELLEDSDIFEWFTRTTSDHFQISLEEAVEMAGGAPQNPMQRSLYFDSRGYPGGGLYTAFRMGGMGYGPSFRPVQQSYRQGRHFEAEQGEAPNVLCVLRDETAEEWERVAIIQAHAGVLDGALQTTGLYYNAFTDQIDAVVEYQRSKLRAEGKL